MNRLTKWVHVLFHREPKDPVPIVEPLQSVVTPARLRSLESAKKHSRHLDRRYTLIQRVLSDYEAQDGILTRRHR